MSDERSDNAKKAAPNWRDTGKKAEKKVMKSAEELMKEMEEKQAKMEKAARKEAKAAKKATSEATAKVEDEAIKAAKSVKTTAKKATEEVAAAPAKNWTFIDEYTVKAGDNLSKVSEKFYGNQGYWSQIYEANKAVIGDNPNVIVPGQVLKIPKL